MKHTESSSQAGGTALAGVSLFAAAWLLVQGGYLTFSLCAYGICTGGQNPWLGGALLILGLGILVFGLVAAPEWAGSSHLTARGAAAIPAAAAAGLVLAQLDLGENVTFFLMTASAVAVLVPPRTMFWIVGLGLGVAIAARLGDVSLPVLSLTMLPIACAAVVKPRARFEIGEWTPALGLPLRPLVAVVRHPARRP